ncbi:C40 family peptidase [Bacillus shivajii]|uniref:C40 family peptidase n=1 Tax=Bacillus shivajii TaxID=1983719 RepID=UPI001CFB3622|nr:C40 family peptidase [Bacillus shivajii]UCZ53958.1 C40 family peptidase [Bacillus shivajii]
MLVNKVIGTGLLYIGTPYVFNAVPFQTNSFDCSSFIQYIFYMNGVELPRNSRQQFLVTKKVRVKELKKGDLLFFTTRKSQKKQGIAKVGHVALYIGEGRILHTSRHTKQVKVEKINKHLKKMFLGARRVV